jgi:mannose-6-phosphate isomerase-like protein (cupin superfamily)
MSTSSSSTPGMARSRAGWLAGQPAQAGPGAAVVIPQGGGAAINAGGMPGLMKIDPGSCGGALLMHEQDIAPMQLVRAHWHASAAQWSLVTRGTLMFRVGSQVHEVREGGFIWRPAAVVHAVWNPGPEPARQVEGNMPGHGMLRYYQRYAELAAAGLPDPEEVSALAAEYGVFFDPGLTAELERAYQVSAAAPSGGGTRP